MGDLAVIIGITCLIIFLLINMPVAFALGVAGVIGLSLSIGIEPVLGILKTSPYRSAANFLLTTIPLFILMAEFVSSAGFAKSLYRAIYTWVGHFPGGMAITTVFAGAGFGAMCGSSTASAAVFSNIALPEMKKYKYDMGLASGTVSMTGTLAVLIPPSVPLIIYGVLTGTSIGKLLIAGILPGLLSATLLVVGILFWVKIRPQSAPSAKRFPWKDRWATLSDLWPILILVFLVIGTIYLGIATPTESSALGALGAWLIGMIMRRLNLKLTVQAIIQTLKSTAMIFAIIIGATLFTNFLTVSGAAQAAITGIAGLPGGSGVVIFVIILMYLILGCFIDPIGAMLLSLPLVFPLISELGLDPIWFGVVVVELMEIALVTPPLGMNVFVVSGTTGIPLEVAFKGCAQLLIFESITLTLIILFPQISLYLPSLMH